MGSVIKKLKHISEMLLDPMLFKILPVVTFLGLTSLVSGGNGSSGLSEDSQETDSIKDGLSRLDDNVLELTKDQAYTLKMLQDLNRRLSANNMGDSKNHAAMDDASVKGIWGEYYGAKERGYIAVAMLKMILGAIKGGASMEVIESIAIRAMNGSIAFETGVTREEGMQRLRYVIEGALNMILGAIAKKASMDVIESMITEALNLINSALRGEVAEIGSSSTLN